MSVLGGAKIPGGSLVVGLDPANPKFSSPAGGSGHKSGSGTVVSHQLLSNMGSMSGVVTASGDPYFGNVLADNKFWTGKAISYPEGNYGGSGYTGTQGLHRGRNNWAQVGQNSYDFAHDRGFTMKAWNRKTDDWVPNSHFNGSRQSGTCYDTYDYTSTDPQQHVKASNDWVTIDEKFGSDLIWYFAGSHANSVHTTAMRDILQECGAPSSFTFTSGGWCEFVMFGVSGSGAGNAIMFAYENGSYGGDSTAQFAHASAGIDSKYRYGENYVQMDGAANASSGMSFTLPSAPFTAAQPNMTISLWQYWTGGTSYHRRWISWGAGGGRFFYGFNTSSGKVDMGLGNQTVTPGFAYAPTANTWEHFAITNSGTTTSFYKNGELVGTGTHGNSTTIDGTSPRIGRQYGSNAEFFQGRMGPFFVYNRTLNANEIRQLFNAHRSRYSV